MTAITSSPNLYACAKHRETHDRKGLKPLLQAAVDARIKRHLSEDRHFAYKLDAIRPSIIAVKGNRMALAQGNQFYLYDLIFRQVIWSGEVLILEGHQIFKMSIFDKEKIRILTKDPDYENFEIIILTSSGILASTTLRSLKVARYSNATRMHKAHLFILENTPLVRMINLISKDSYDIDLEGIHRKHVSMTTITDDFYVLITRSDPINRVPAKVFVFDRLTQQKRIIDLELSEHIIYPSSTYIHRNHLFCGMQYPSLSSNKTCFTTMLVMNLVTGKIVKICSLDPFQKPIEKCVANEAWLVFLIKDRLKTLWCVNLLSNQLKRILNFENPEEINLTLSGNQLNICRVSNHGGWFSAIDLSSMATIIEVELEGSSKDSMHYHEGKLVVINQYDPNRATFYIEDYLNPEKFLSQNLPKESLAIRAEASNE